MATPGEKLAQSLVVLKKLQDSGMVAIKSASITRLHRERLLEARFIKEVMKGWYLATPTEEQQGGSTSWYASYWSFCAEYLADRYGDSYCISAEQSLQIQTGNWTVPQQLIIRSLNGPNGITNLPHSTSLVTMKSTLPESAEIEKKEGIHMLSLPASLINCAAVTFTTNPTDTRTALTMIKDASEVVRLLLDGGHSKIAGRLAGAFRNIGKGKIADEILKTMQKVGYDVRESDPFENPTTTLLSQREVSPYATRIKLIWTDMREVVIANFPKAPGIPKNVDNYMKQVEAIYVLDAYHSLSIERYKVSWELIDRVRSGEWDTTDNAEDKKQRDAMAARGYWQATQKVRDSIRKIMAGENAGDVIEDEHGDWYLELFSPSVTAGILKPSDLAGYRSGQVYIGQSKHVPLNKNAVRDAMPTLFELLKQEPEASVRAVLGHFIFVYIHPYMDGNGRMGRFLMNTMLASGGYPWTVVTVEERNDYMKALEKASTELDIEDFTKLIAKLTTRGPQRKEIIIPSEFPPYKFYQNPLESKFKTWRVDLSQGFTKIQLENIKLNPINLKNSFKLTVKAENKTIDVTDDYLLNEMTINPVIDGVLFFDRNHRFMELELPEGTTHVTYELELLTEVENFEMELNCKYV
ncbi:MAG: Fic family protein [Crocinitomicaceae bacterium]|nr:Fic family protein [Crocinitomicaceae bacterium]